MYFVTSFSQGGGARQILHLNLQYFASFNAHIVWGVVKYCLKYNNSPKLSKKELANITGVVIFVTPASGLFCRVCCVTLFAQGNCATFVILNNDKTVNGISLDLRHNDTEERFL